MRKEEITMTNEQFQKVIQMILIILEKSKNLEEAKEEIRKLL